MAPALTSPPLQTPLVEPPNMGRPPSWLVTKVWADWLDALIGRAQTAAYAAGSVTLTAQNASLPVTVILPTVAAGRYRVSVHARVTTADGVSSSLTPTISYTNGAVPCTQVGAALASDAVNAPASWTFEVIADSGTAISYSTTYASNTPGQMVYEIDFLLEVL